jgi:hypothetical protein
MSEEEQLKYVLPKEEKEKRYEWGFCRYLWEAHPIEL